MLDRNKLKKPFIELQSLRKKEFTYPERFDVGNNIINAIIDYNDAILSTLDEDQKENYPFKKNYNFGEADKIINEYLEKFHKVVTKVPTKNLGSRIYAPLEEKKIETGNGLEEFTIKHAPKSELFEQAFNKVFLGGEIYIDYENKFEETLDEHQMRKFPYIIYHIKSSDPKKSKTILISDQVGEATFVYPGLIDISRFRDNGITKEGDIDGLLPIKVIFGKNYEKRIIDIIQVDNSNFHNIKSNTQDTDDYKRESEYFNQLESIKGFLSNPVDESRNSVNIDLKIIGIGKFGRVRFTYNGESISGYVLLTRNGFNVSNMGFKGLLSLIGIERDDIQEGVKSYKFEDYKKYFEGNKEEFEDFGCKFSEKDGKEMVDLSGIGNPNKVNLFGIRSVSSLKHLGKVLGIGSGKELKTIKEAQDILKKFFEEMGYELVGDFEYYKKYFEGNKKEFEKLGCDFNEEGGKNIVDLSDIKSPQKFDLFGMGAISSLKHLGKVLGIGSGKELKTIKEAQDILKVFFEKMGYKVVIQEVVKLEKLEDYKKYFEKNKEEFVTFGCKFNKENEKSVVDLSGIGNPNKVNLFGIGAQNSLKNLGNTLKIGSGEVVINKKDSQDVLKLFFEKMGYEVVIEEVVKGENFEDYKKYFEGNKQEFEKIGCEFSEEDGENIVDLSNILRPTNNNFKLFGIGVASSLKHLGNALGIRLEGRVKNKKEVQNILKLFFEKMGYKVLRDHESRK